MQKYKNEIIVGLAVAAIVVIGIIAFSAKTIIETQNVYVTSADGQATVTGLGAANTGTENATGAIVLSTMTEPNPSTSFDSAVIGGFSVNGQLQTEKVAITTSTSSACVITNNWGDSIVEKAFIDITTTIPTSTTWRVGTSSSIVILSTANDTIIDDAVLATSTDTLLNNYDNAGTNGLLLSHWDEDESIRFVATSTFNGDFNATSVLPSGNCYVEFRVK